LMVPSDARIQTYPITIKAYSDAVNASKVSAISVFASEKDRLFYEIQFLKGRYRDLSEILAVSVQNNKNVTDVIDLMTQAKLQIDTAGKFVDDGALRNAADAIRKAHNLLDRAEFELNACPDNNRPPSVISFFFP